MKYIKMIISKMSVALFLLLLGGNTLFAEEMNKKQFAKYQEGHRLLFSTARGPKELKKAIDILEALYKELDQKNAIIGIDYAYAVYYEASYIYPKNQSKYDAKRVINYKKARTILEDSLDQDINDKELLGNLYLTSGLVLGELAAMTESAIVIFKSRKFLEKALATAPKIQNGAVYIALGRMYDRVPRMLFGNKDKSLKYLRMAQTQFPKPNIISFYYEVELIISERPMKQVSAEEKVQIKQILSKGLLLSKLRRMTPEEDDAIKYMKLLLKEI